MADRLLHIDRAFQRGLESSDLDSRPSLRLLQERGGEPAAAHADDQGYPVTPDSIAAAKAAQQAERARVTAVTGVRFTEDDRMVRPDPVRDGLLIANAIAAAVYGPQGERR